MAIYYVVALSEINNSRIIGMPFDNFTKATTYYPDAYYQNQSIKIYVINTSELWTSNEREIDLSQYQDIKVHEYQGLDKVIRPSTPYINTNNAAGAPRFFKGKKESTEISNISYQNAIDDKEKAKTLLQASNLSLAPYEILFIINAHGLKDPEFSKQANTWLAKSNKSIAKLAESNIDCANLGLSEQVLSEQIDVVDKARILYTYIDDFANPGQVSIKVNDLLNQAARNNQLNTFEIQQLKNWKIQKIAEQIYDERVKYWKESGNSDIKMRQIVEDHLKKEGLNLDDIRKVNTAKKVFQSSSVLRVLLPTVQEVAQNIYDNRQLYWDSAPHNYPQITQQITDTLAKNGYTLKDISEDTDAARIFKKSSLLKSILNKNYPDKAKDKIVEIAEEIYDSRDAILYMAAKKNPDQKNLSATLEIFVNIIQKILQHNGFTIQDIHNNIAAKEIFEKSKRLQYVLDYQPTNSPNILSPEVDNNQFLKQHAAALARKHANEGQGLVTQIGIDRDIVNDPEQLKKELRKIQLELHPDKNNGKSPDEEKVRLINELNDLIRQGGFEQYRYDYAKYKKY